METISKSECRKIGFIRKTHGVQGEVVLEFDPEFEDSVAEADRFFLEMEGLLVPFFISEDGLRFKTANSALIAFDWIKTENQARRLTGAHVYLYEQEIFQQVSELPHSQLINYRLTDETNREIGLVTAVDDYSGNVVLTVDASVQEILVPYNDELVIEKNDEKKILKLKLPEGLI